MEFAMLRKEITEFINIEILKESRPYNIINTNLYDEYTEKLITYEGTEGSIITAFLLEPKGKKNGKGLLIHHQHNGERHLGKSEIIGKVGDVNQHLGLKFVKKGYVIIAPDSICFEDRRHQVSGVSEDKNDFVQHYSEMNKRILLGESLMKKVIEESSIAISILLSQEDVLSDMIGILGHSYGGNTALFHGALDTRIKYTCTSGAVASYSRRLRDDTGIEMASIIPGFIQKYEMLDVLKAVLPREMLILSATHDKYSIDADEIYEQLIIDSNEDTRNSVRHYRFDGNHALTEERVAKIIEWFESK